MHSPGMFSFFSCCFPSHRHFSYNNATNGTMDGVEREKEVRTEVGLRTANSHITGIRAAYSRDRAASLGESRLDWTGQGMHTYSVQ
jgi:hypothetical protein